MASPIRSMSAVGFSSSKWSSLPKPTMAWVRGTARRLLRRGSALTFSSSATRSNFSRIAFWSSFMLSDSSKSQTTVSLCCGEVAEDLAGDLVEGDADVAGLEGRRRRRSCRRRPGRSPASAVEGEHAQAGDVGHDLDARAGSVFSPMPRPTPATRGVADGGPLPIPAKSRRPRLLAGRRAALPTAWSRGASLGSA